MFYFDFSGTLSRWDVFVHAAVFTVGLSIAAALLGLVIGVAGAVARLSRSRLARSVAFSYVELIRNTPFLVQIYIIYFGLPCIGTSAHAITAAILRSLYAGPISRRSYGPESRDRQGPAGGSPTLGLVRTLHVSVTSSWCPPWPHLPGAHEPVHPGHAGFQRGVGHLGAGVDWRANDIQGLTFRSLEAFLIVAAFTSCSRRLQRPFSAIDRSSPFLPAHGPGNRHVPDLLAHHVGLSGSGPRLDAAPFADRLDRRRVFGAVLVAFSGSRSSRRSEDSRLAYIYAIQGMPLLVLLFIAYFGLSFLGWSAADRRGRRGIHLYASRVPRRDLGVAPSKPWRGAMGRRGGPGPEWPRRCARHRSASRP